MLSDNQPKRVTSSKLKIAAVLIFVLSALSAVVLSVINSMYMGENYLYENGAPTLILPILAALAVALAVLKDRYGEEGAKEKIRNGF